MHITSELDAGAVCRASPGQAGATDDVLPTIVELVCRVQNEANARADEASSQLGIPAGLAAAVETLSCKLVGQGNPKAVLTAPAAAAVAADVQDIYCRGSLLTCFCSRSAVMHMPAAVSCFLIGLRGVVGTFPETAVDYQLLNELAGHVDSAVEAAAQYQKRGRGTSNCVVQLLHQDFVGAAASCMAAPGAVERWGLTPASAALEPMLHLALAELNAACQLAAEQLGSTAGSRAPHTKQQQKAAQTHLLGDQLDPHQQHRANGAVLLLSILVALAEEAADQGRLNLQRFMECAPALIEFADLYGNPASCLPPPQLSMLESGICGLTIVLNLQRRLLFSVQAPSRSTASKPAIAAALDQRMQWVAAAAASAKVLHKAADAAADNGSEEGGPWGTGWEKVAKTAGGCLARAIPLIGDMYPSSWGPGLITFVGGRSAPLAGDQPAFSSYLALLQLAELLVRLVPKRSVLAWVCFSSKAGDAQLSETRGHLLNYAAWMADEVQGAPLLSRQQQAPMAPQPASDSPSSSSSSRGTAAAEAEVLLRGIASLAATAAKLCHCLPNLAALDPGEARRGFLGSSYHYTALLQKATELCYGVLALNTHLVEAPGRQRSLTHHLQSTGFLTFLCLPALAQAHGSMDPYDRATLVEHRDTENFIAPLLGQLDRLHLIDDGGGLGPLLKQCLENLLTPRLLGKAVPLLMRLVQGFAADHTEGLAVALVKDGLLRAAAEQSLRLAGEGIRRARDMEETVKGILPRHTALLLRAVCDVLDDHGGLLTAFAPLLGDVPTLPKLPTLEARAGRTAVFARGPWVARFGTRQAWEQVCNQLLPALTAACDEVTSESQAEQQDGIFHDVAVSAWTCCNPSCTNMAGQQEASLALSKCAGCGEARYCSRPCQWQDWCRHKPICQAIRELK